MCATPPSLGRGGDAHLHSFGCPARLWLPPHILPLGKMMSHTCARFCGHADFFGVHKPLIHALQMWQLPGRVEP